jgi:hypothetical protein
VHFREGDVSRGKLKMNSHSASDTTISLGEFLQNRAATAPFKLPSPKFQKTSPFGEPFNAVRSATPSCESESDRHSIPRADWHGFPQPSLALKGKANLRILLGEAIEKAFDSDWLPQAYSIPASAIDDIAFRFEMARKTFGFATAISVWNLRSATSAYLAAVGEEIELLSDHVSITPEIIRPHTFVLYHPECEPIAVSVWWDVDSGTFHSWSGGAIEQASEGAILMALVYHRFMRSSVAAIERPPNAKVGRHQSRKRESVQNQISIVYRRKVTPSFEVAPIGTHHSGWHLEHEISVAGHKRVYHRGAPNEFIVDVREHTRGPKGCKKLTIAKVTR